MPNTNLKKCQTCLYHRPHNRCHRYLVSPELLADKKDCGRNGEYPFFKEVQAILSLEARAMNFKKRCRQAGTSAARQNRKLYFNVMPFCYNANQISKHSIKFNGKVV